MKIVMLMLVLGVPIFGESLQERMDRVSSMIKDIAQENNLPPYFVLAIALEENGLLDPEAVSIPNRNGTQDRGIMQLNSAYFYNIDWWCEETNIRAGVNHIKWIMRSFPEANTFWSVAVTYNGGHGWLRGLNPPHSSLEYADRVMLRWLQMSPLTHRALIQTRDLR